VALHKLPILEDLKAHFDKTYSGLPYVIINLFYQVIYKKRSFCGFP